MKEAKKVPPRISIVIPVYNQEKYVRECLDSIVNQSLKNIEIVIVNDGSTDSSEKIIREYMTKDERIIFITQKNQGSGPARNNGIRNSTGKYIAFMDPDDYYPEKNILEKMYESAMKNDAIICGGSLSRIDGNKFITKFNWDLAYGNTFEKEGFIEYKDWQFDTGYWRFIFDREFLVNENIYFPHYRRFQDPPFFVKVMTAAKRFYAIPDITYCYRQTPKAIITEEWPESIFCDMLRGIIDILYISKKEKLAKLHVIMVRKLEEYAYFTDIIKYLQKGSPEVFKLTLEIYMNMDAGLLQSYEKFKPRIKDDVFAWKLISEAVSTYKGYAVWLNKTEKFRNELTGSIDSMDELKKLCIGIQKICKGLDIYGKTKEEQINLSEEQVIAAQAFMAMLPLRAALRLGPEGANIVRRNLPCEAVAQALAYKHWDNMAGFSEELIMFIEKTKNKKIKPKLAIYYHRLNGGGVERVMSLLIPIFVEMGYEIVVVTQEEPSPDDYEIPTGVKREIIYNYRLNSPNKLYYRFQSWRKIIASNNIGLVLYEAWIEKVLTWDVFFIRLLGTRCLIQTHGIASYAVIRDWEWWSQLIDTYKLAESVVVLSEANRYFWSSFHDNVYYVPNPIGSELRNVHSEVKHNHILIWVGRLSKEKRPWLAIEVMAEIVKLVPDAKLLMVGDEDRGTGLREICKEMIKKYGLENNVELCGFTLDVSRYWKQASIHLFTTLFEGFPMVLLEAKAYGLPTVMTDLPYLSMAQPNTGVIGIPGMDVRKATVELVKLLTDEPTWKRESSAARKNFEAFLNFDYKKAWTPILEGIINKKQLSIQSGQVMLRTLVNHHLLGREVIQNRYEERQKQWQADLKHLSNQLSILNNKANSETKPPQNIHKREYINQVDLSIVYWGAKEYISGANPEKDIIVDENSSLWGTIVSGMPVCSPEALSSFSKPFKIIINKKDDKTIKKIIELGYEEQAGF